MSAHDFDFLFGDPWVVTNRRLNGRDEWDTFAAHCEVEPLPRAAGHLDRLSFPALPGAGAVDAFTLRLHEPTTDLWRIWWSSSQRPGHLDAPMLGSFSEGVGTFDGEDLDRAVRLRFRWLPEADAGPRWEQARSRDDGRTWHTDWTMDLAR